MKNTWMIDVIVTAVSLILAFWVYDNTLINADVAWHIEGARRILAGGDYLTNLFDNNSPFVFIFYIPVILLIKTNLFSVIHTIYGYLLFWNLVALTLSYLILNRIYQNNIFTKRVLYFTSIFIVCFLPQASFGQREIVLITLFLPYFFVSLHSLLTPSDSKLPATIMVISTLLAIFAMTQNFIYLILPLFIDLFIYIKRATFKVYNLLFYLGIFLCIGLIASFYPHYINYIVPMTLCYESGFNYRLGLLFLEIFVVISFLTVLLVIVHYKKLGEKNDITLLCGLIVLSLMIYFIEKKLWYYHFFPVVTFTILLLALIIAKSFKQELFHQQHPKNEITLYLSLSMVVMIVLTIIMDFKNDIISYHQPKNEIRQWVNYANKNFLNKKLFFFVIRLGPAYSLPIYSQARIVSPWSNPWFVPNIITSQTSGLFCNPQRDMQVFYAITTKSLKEQQPDFIIIENIKQRLQYLNDPFDYVKFFSKDKAIKTLLDNYNFYDSFLGFNIYKHK